MATIRVLIADDHPVVRTGVRRLIETESRADIVRYALETGRLSLTKSK